MERERKVCPNCKTTKIQKKRYPPSYICKKCKMIFSMPEVLILDHNSRVLPKYLNIKKDEMDENKN